MREHPFHWPPRDDLGFVQGVQLATGDFMCAEYRRDGLELYEPGDTFWGFMDKLKASFPYSHWVVGMEAIGCIGRSRNVSRNHPLNEGETLA